MTGFDPHGLLLVDKPAGPTSHDIVHRVRRAGASRVGHAGTLDPAASGLLPLVLGRATRLVRFLPASPKVYRGTLRLGVSTTTDDEQGDVVAEHSGPLPAVGRVLEVAAGLQGKQAQVPPAYSARRVAGRRMYELARSGVTVEAAPTQIDVARFDLTPQDAGRGVYAFVVEVSPGTYVRGLARDLGLKLGCGGVLSTLVRTRIGPMLLDDALPCPADASADARWIERALIPLHEMPLSPPILRLAAAEDASRFRLGGALCPVAGREDGPVRVLSPDGLLLGIGELSDGRLQPRVVVSPAPD